MWRTTPGIRQVTGAEMASTWYGRWDQTKQTIWRTHVLRLAGYFSDAEMLARAVLRGQIRQHAQVLGINLGVRPLEGVDSTDGFTIEFPGDAGDKVMWEWNLGKGRVEPGGVPFGGRVGPAAPMGGWLMPAFMAPPPGWQPVQQPQHTGSEDDAEYEEEE